MARLFFTAVVFLAGWLLGAGPGMAQVINYLPPPQALHELPAGPAYVSRVVDARPEHTPLGYSKLGNQVAQPIFFQEALPVAMQAFFTHYAPGQPAATPLVLRLLDIQMAEKAGRSNPTVAASMQAEFYTVQPDSSYRLVARFASAQQQPIIGGSGAIPICHATNLGSLLLQAAATGSNQAAWVSGPSYPASAVFAAAPRPSAAPVVLQPDTPLNPGFYYSLSDFLANAPHEPGVPEVESRPYLGTEWAGDYELKPYRRDAAGQRVLATDVWGFCDGQQAYILKGTDFYKLHIREHTVDFFGRAGTGPLLHSAINLVAVATLVSGYGGIISTDPEHRVLYQLDLATGEVTQSASMGMTTGPNNDRPTRLFVYRPRSAKGATVHVRLAADQPLQELAAGEYLSFSPPAGVLVQLSLQPADGPVVQLSVLPITTAPIYLECRPADPAPLRQVPDAVGAAALTRLLK